MIGRKKIIPNRRCIFMIKISSDHPSLPVLNLDANRYTVLRDFLAEWRIFNLRIVVIMHGKDLRGEPIAADQRAKASRRNGFLTEKLVSRFAQTPFGAAGICREVTDQFTRGFVHVGTFEVIELLAPKVEN
jgi:hypothetical protein